MGHPFLQNRFYSLYERAQQNCWLVCIPVATSVDPSQVIQALVGKNSKIPVARNHEVMQ